MIPKKIHFCWLSNDPYPELIHNCIESWKQKMPDYEFVLWNFDRFNINLSKWVKQSFDNKKYAFAADYIRLYALYHQGGIYLDSDVEVIKRFDNLLNHKSFIGFETTGDLEPAIIGAEPQMLWLKKCLDYYENRSFVKDDGSLDTKPLPLIVSEILHKEMIALKKEKLPITINDISFYPAEYFSPKNIHSKKISITKNTIAIHHFDGSWVNEGIKGKFKSQIHLIILKLLGEKWHKKIVDFLRKMK